MDTSINRFRLRALLGAAFLLTMVLQGCGQKQAEMEKQKPTVTIENLQAAYSKSIKYKDMYAQFAKQADKEGFKNLASLYRAVALSEDIHAANHAELLRTQGMEPLQPVPDSLPPGKTLQYLKRALGSEDIEIKSLYPNLIQTAEAEKYTQAAAQFTNTLEADKRHVELIKEAFEKSGKISKVQYLVCKACGYIITSAKTEECPVCKTKKELFQKV